MSLTPNSWHRHCRPHHRRHHPAIKAQNYGKNGKSGKDKGRGRNLLQASRAVLLPVPP